MPRPNSTRSNTCGRGARSIRETRTAVILFALSVFAWTRPAWAGIGYGWISHGPVGGPVNALAIDPSSPDRAYAGTEAGVFKTADGGASWATINAGFVRPFTVNLVKVHPTNPNILFASMDWNGLYRSTDGGQSWTYDFGPVTENLSFDPADPNRVIAMSSFGSTAWLSTNAGATWSTYPTPPPGGLDALVYAPSNPAVAYAVVGSSVYRSSDGGVTWAPAGTGLPTPTYN